MIKTITHLEFYFRLQHLCLTIHLCFNISDHEERTTFYKNPFCMRSSNLHGVETYLLGVPSVDPHAMPGFSRFLIHVTGHQVFGAASISPQGKFPQVLQLFFIGYCVGSLHQMSHKNT